MNLRYLGDTGWAMNHLNGQERTRQRLEELAASGLGFSIIRWPRSTRASTTQATPKGTSKRSLNSCKT